MSAVYNGNLSRKGRKLLFDLGVFRQLFIVGSATLQTLQVSEQCRHAQEHAHMLSTTENHS